MELCLLWWNRVSLDREVVHPAAARAIRAVFAPVEKLLGPVPEDTDQTKQRVKIANLLRGFVPAFGLYVAACGLVLFSLPPGDRRVLRTVLAFGLLFRVTLAPFPPILETDLHRYLWDGAVSAHHVNPYQFAPVEVSSLSRPGHRDLYVAREVQDLLVLDGLCREPALAEHFARINHPRIPTLYPPIAQILFSLAYRISPGGAGTLKLIVALLDMAVVGMVLALLARLSRNPCQSILYAWSPLVLKEYSNTGHFDPLATLLVLAALHLLLEGRSLFAAIALALGSATKLYPAVLTVLLARRLGILGIALWIAILAGLYAPHAAIGVRLFDGLRAMGETWEFNSSLYALAQKAVNLTILPRSWVVRIYATPSGSTAWNYVSDDIAIDDFLIAKLLCAACGLAFLAALMRRRGCTGDADLVGSCFALTAAMVLLSPVSDPWYFCWLMPFVAIFPAGSWIYLSGTMVVYYIYFWDWAYTSWSRAVEYVPFYVLLVWEHRSVISGCVARVARRAPVPAP
jgi:hypothetical protein